MKRLFFVCSFLFLATLLLSHPFAYAECVAEGQFQNLCKINATDNMTFIRDAIQVLLVIASLAALFFLLYGGLKWVLSGGDKTKIGEARGMLTAAIVGLIVTFSCFFIISIITTLFGIKGGTIFVLPQLINEKPSLPINTQDKSGNMSGEGSQNIGPGATR